MGLKKNEIRQRRKGTRKGKEPTSISVDAILRSEFEDIPLTIKGMPDAWESLYLNFDPANDEHMTQLARLIWMNAIKPVWGEVLLPQRQHKVSFEEKSQKFVAAAYAVIEHRLRTDSSTVELQRILKRCEEAGINVYDKREYPQRTVVPSKLAYHLWKETFAGDIEQLGLSGPRNEKSFRAMYEQGNPYMEEAKSILEKSPRPLTVGELTEFMCPGEYGVTIEPHQVQTPTIKFTHI